MRLAVKTLCNQCNVATFVSEAPRWRYERMNLCDKYHCHFRVMIEGVDLGELDTIDLTLPAHGSVLLKLTPLPLASKARHTEP